MLKLHLKVLVVIFREGGAGRPSRSGVSREVAGGLQPLDLLGAPLLRRLLGAGWLLVPTMCRRGGGAAV